MNFTVDVIDAETITCDNEIFRLVRLMRNKTSVCYQCSKPKCLAKIMLNKDGTKVLSTNFIHSHGSNSSSPCSIAAGGGNKVPKNSTPVSARPIKGRYLPVSKSPSSLNSSLSSPSGSEYRTPLSKPPRHSLLPDDPIHSPTSLSKSSLIDSHDPSNISSVPSGLSSTVLFNDSSNNTVPATAEPENVALRKRIDELLVHRDSLIGKIQELTTQLEASCPPVQNAKSDKTFSPRRIAIFSDSMCRGVSKILNSKFSSQTNVTSYVKPNATFHQVTEDVASFCRDFTIDDIIVILGGTNDMSLVHPESGEILLQPNSAKLLPVKHFVKLASQTNIIICSIPYRFDNLSYLSSNIYETNIYLKHVCLKHKLTYFDTNIFMSKSLYSADGLHFNMKGKHSLSNKLLRCFKGLPARVSCDELSPSTFSVSSVAASTSGSNDASTATYISPVCSSSYVEKTVNLSDNVNSDPVNNASLNASLDSTFSFDHTAYVTESRSNVFQIPTISSNRNSSNFQAEGLIPKT